MTYRELLAKLHEMKRNAPEKLDDQVSVVCALSGDNTAFPIRVAQYNDGSVEGCDPYQLLLMDV